MKHIRKIWRWSPATSILGGLILMIWLSAVVWSQNSNFPAGVGTLANNPLPAATSGPGPVFNVKNYGAFGDTQSSLNGTPATTVLNCTDCAFTSADVGKRITCAAAFVTQVGPTTTITAVNSATQVAISPNSSGNNPCVVVWGHPDDAAALAACAAATAQMSNKFNAGGLGYTKFSPTLYFPAGNYNFVSFVCGPNPSPAVSGFAFLGDGPDETKLYWNTGTTAAGILGTSGSVGEFRIEGMTLDGALGDQTTPNIVLALSSARSYLHNLIVQRFGVSEALLLNNVIHADRVTVVGNKVLGIVCQPCSGSFINSISSNNGAGAGGSNGANLLIQNSAGGAGFHWFGYLIDECGGVGACTQLINSDDVYLSGGFFAGLGGPAISVDAASFAHINQASVGVFAQDTNLSGLTIAAPGAAGGGGVVQASDTRFFSTGTGKCITNNGVFKDNGGNTCENMFQIASGTSTGTAAVLTLTANTAAPNANCSVGDALMVQSANLAGYIGYYPAGATSGITATSATTVSYTTTASNIGAIGSGGFAFCRNLQSYSGNLPQALLNNPIPNTCYVTITPIVSATTYTICNFASQSATNITHITASSQSSTTCATAPIITITNGTVSQTLTLTTAKSAWDSSTDSSTGVGTTIFKPNTTITVKYDAGALSSCATPPTNLAVSYNISPILSN
jgi:hypothetical protein